MKNKHLKIKRIKPHKNYVLKISTFLSNKYEFSFKATEVKHSGINKKRFGFKLFRQKSLGLKFKIRNIKEKNTNKKEEVDVLNFGITSDLDGRKEFIKKYKAFFNECYFLITHLGSAKYFEQERNVFKHLYPEGLYRFLNELNGVKAFIIQEFGLEIAEPNYLADVLSPVILKNGYYLPYIIFCHIFYGKTEKIVKNLFSKLIPNFLTDFKMIGTSIFRLQEATVYNYRKIFEFGHVMCLDFDEIDSYDKFTDIGNFMESNTIHLNNIWDNSKLLNGRFKRLMWIFDEIWKILREVLFLKINDINFEKIESLGKKINLFFRAFNFYDSIKKNCEYLVKLCDNKSKRKILNHFEDLFKENRFNILFSWEEKTIYIGWRINNIESRYIGSHDKSELFKYQLFPVLIFLSVLCQFSSEENPNSLRNFKSNLLRAFQNLFPKKNICLGDYGKKIDFDVFFKSFYKCIKCKRKTDCKEERNGKNLFKLKCLKEKEQQYLEIPEDYYEEKENENLEAEIELKKEQSIKEKRLENKFETLLKNRDFNGLIEFINRKNKYDTPYKEEYFDLFKEHLSVEYVQKIIFLYFFYPTFIRRSSTFENLCSTVLKLVTLKIKDYDVKYLLKFIEALKNIFKFNNSRKILRDFDSRSFKIQGQLLRIILKLCLFICQYHQNFDEIQFESFFNNLKGIMTSLPDKFNMAIRNTFYYNFKYIRDKENQLEFFKNLFLSTKFKLFRVFNDIN